MDVVRHNIGSTGEAIDYAERAVFDLLSNHDGGELDSIALNAYANALHALVALKTLDLAQRTRS